MQEFYDSFIKHVILIRCSKNQLAISLDTFRERGTIGHSKDQIGNL